MTSKLRIKIGEVEIEYEGSEDFLKQELPQLLKTAMDLHKASGASANKTSPASNNAGNGAGGDIPALTTTSIAAKIGAKYGSDLLLAAAANFALVKKKEPFTRQELLKEMQSATAYYKKNYSANLSRYIKTALSDEVLSETATNSFALGAKTRTTLVTKLADN